MTLLDLKDTKCKCKQNLRLLYNLQCIWKVQTLSNFLLFVMFQTHH